MRKLLSVLMAAVMLVALAVPAMADGSPEDVPQIGDGQVTLNENKPTLDSGKLEDTKGGQAADDLHIEVNAFQSGNDAGGTSAEDAANNALKAAADKGIDVDSVASVNVFDVGVYKEQQKQESSSLSPDLKATVVVTKTESGEVAGVMYYHDGAWHKAEFTVSGNNITITMNGFCTVAVMYKAAVPPVNPGKTTSTGTSSPKSPKTGYD